MRAGLTCLLACLLAHAGPLVVRVLDAETQAAIAVAVVTASGSDVLAVADSLGQATVPELGRHGWLAAQAEGYVPDSVPAETARRRPSVMLFRDLVRVVRGRVCEEQSGRPLGSARVLLLPDRDVRPGVDGVFVIGDFPSGEQKLEAVLDGYVSARQQVLAKGGETTEVVLRLLDTASLGSVNGTVTERRTGVGVGGASLEIEAGGARAVADSLGRYVIDCLPEGEYWLVCRAEGYAAQKIRFRVLADWTVDVSFRLVRR